MCEHCRQDPKVMMVQGLITQALSNYTNFLQPAFMSALYHGDQQSAQAASMLRVGYTKGVIALLETMAASGCVGMARPTEIPVFSDGESEDTIYQMLIRAVRDSFEAYKDPTDSSWPETYSDRLEECVRILDARYEAELADAEDRDIGFSDVEQKALEELRAKFVILSDKEPSHDGA